MTLHELTDDTPLGTARQIVLADVDGGIPVDCPLCTRKVAKRKRLLNPGWVRLMKAINDDRGQEWVHVRDEYERGKDKDDPVRELAMMRDFPLIWHWKLMETQKLRGESKTYTGEWRVTDAGVKFLSGSLRVPEWKKILLNKDVESSTTTVNFDELMAKGDGKLDFRDTFGDDDHDAELYEVLFG